MAKAWVEAGSRSAAFGSSSALAQGIIAPVARIAQPRIEDFWKRAVHRIGRTVGISIRDKLVKKRIAFRLPRVYRIPKRTDWGLRRPWLTVFP